MVLTESVPGRQGGRAGRAGSSREGRGNEQASYRAGRKENIDVDDAIDVTETARPALTTKHVWGELRPLGRNGRSWLPPCRLPSSRGWLGVAATLVWVVCTRGAGRLLTAAGRPSRAVPVRRK